MRFLRKRDPETGREKSGKTGGYERRFGGFFVCKTSVKAFSPGYGLFAVRMSKPEFCGGVMVFFIVVVVLNNLC